MEEARNTFVVREVSPKTRQRRRTQRGDEGNLTQYIETGMLTIARISDTVATVYPRPFADARGGKMRGN